MNQEACAQLIETMMDDLPWKDKPWSRCALAVAARAIRRGRLLTEKEKYENLTRALRERDPCL